MDIHIDTNALDEGIRNYFKGQEPVNYRWVKGGKLELWAYGCVLLLSADPKTNVITLGKDIELSSVTDYNVALSSPERERPYLLGYKSALKQRLKEYVKRQVKKLWTGSIVRFDYIEETYLMRAVVQEACTAVDNWIWEYKVFDQQAIKYASDLLSVNIDNYHFALFNEQYVKEMYANLPKVVTAHFENFYNWELRTKVGVRQPIPDLMKRLKEYYMNLKKLSNANWKTLLKLKPKDMEWYESHGRYEPVMEYHVLNHHAVYGKFPRVTGCKAIRELFRSNYRFRANFGVDENAAWRDVFIQQALAGSREAVNIRQWANNEFYQVRDWLQSDEGIRFRPDKNQMKAKWGWFLRESEKWHDQMALRRLEQNAAGLNQGDVVANDPRIWKSEFYEMKLPALNIRIVALTRAVDLALEGHSMGHCVGSYAHRCATQNDSRIFSLRVLDGENKDNRIATCQIVLGNSTSKWRLEQIRGKRNAEVTPEVKQVGEAIALAYNEAYKRRIEAEEAEKKRLEEIAKEEERKRKAAEAAEKARLAEEARKLKEEEANARAEGARGLLVAAEVNTNVVLLPLDEDEEKKAERLMA